MKTVTIVSLAVGIAVALAAAPADAQQPAYGPAITLEQAKKVMAGAEAEAGAIGVSGVTGEQDAQIAKAGVESLDK